MTALPTLARIRREETRLVVAVDTEFYYPGGSRSREREVLTWQLTFAEPADPASVHSLVFYSATGARLGLGRALSYCISRFGLAQQMQDERATCCEPNGYRFSDSRRWVVPTYDTKGAHWNDYALGGSNPDWVSCTSIDDALGACADPDFLREYKMLKSSRKQPGRVRLNREDPSQLAGYVNDFSEYHREKACHPRYRALPRRQGRPLRLLLRLRREGRAPSGERGAGRSREHARLHMNPSIAPSIGTNGEWWRFFPLNVSVRDTMCFAPAGHKSLGELGEAVGFSKLSLKHGYTKDAMQDYLANEPVAFMDYASRDSEVTLRFAGTLFDYNRARPVTASAAAVSSIVQTISSEWGIKGSREFDEEWAWPLPRARRQTRFSQRQARSGLPRGRSRQRRGRDDSALRPELLQGRCQRVLFRGLG